MASRGDYLIFFLCMSVRMYSAVGVLSAEVLQLLDVYTCRCCYNIVYFRYSVVVFFKLANCWVGLVRTVQHALAIAHWATGK